MQHKQLSLDYPEQASITQNAVIEEQLGASIDAKSDCVYFSASTYTSLGFGDIFAYTQYVELSSVEV